VPLSVFIQRPLTRVARLATRRLSADAVGGAYTDKNRLSELVGHLERAEAETPPDYAAHTAEELYRAANAARARLSSLAEHSDRWRTYETLDAITEELRRR
jgi:hypothetical protein